MNENNRPGERTRNSGNGRRPGKYIFVTGGVLSSLGKGVAAASIGALLEARGLSVNLIKLTPISMSIPDDEPVPARRGVRHRRRRRSRPGPGPLRRFSMICTGKPAIYYREISIRP
jgi:hypothetical protein